MKSKIQNIFSISVIALVMVLAGATSLLAQAEVKSVPSGEKAKVLGLINTRGADTFIMTTLDGTSRYNVVLTESTSVKSNTKGVFRGGTEYGASYLLRGLRIEVEGAGGDNGAIVAKSIRFNETDLRTAQSLESRIDPVEENAKHMAGQIDENTALANRAQGTADEALASATRANTRINGLDEFDPVKTIVVPFATGSSRLGPKGMAIIDEAAGWVKTQNTKGWMVSVVGFADSTGKSASNKTLSEKRANAVIGYMVSKHALPITRLIQPFGAGVDKPVATNETAEGRAQNRRVEIHLLVNKGIAG
ncbi:MAG: OmpA family protein [Saprospiraceae bacterium]|nr:OmpA family protein [Pyrinomonadaceae bacterium]